MDGHSLGKLTGSMHDGDRHVKRKAIDDACRQNDQEALVNLASSAGGFLEDELRVIAWPLLLNCTAGEGRDTNPAESWWDLAAHRDEEQVQRDVDRAFVYYPNNESQQSIQARKSKLYDLIVMILRSYPMLCYFQGYHDIVQVLLLVLGQDIAFVAASKLSLFRIRDYMLPTLAPAIKHLELIPAILRAADPELASHLSTTRPFFALSATLTLYAHDIEEYGDIARVYDFVIANEPVMTIYLFAATVIRRREKLLDIPVDEPEMLHFILSKLPQPLDLEAFITLALDLFARYPPERLPDRVWNRISSHSVLKTSRDISAKQDDSKAQGLFESQKMELKRDEYIVKGLKVLARNKRPLVSVTAAFFAGAVSIWLQRSGYGLALYASAWRVYRSLKSI